MSDQPPDELAAKRAAKPPRKRGVKKGRLPGSVADTITSQREIRLSEKQSTVLGLRMAGATLQQIADQRGEDGERFYSSPSGAHNAILAALKIILPDQTRDQARAMELARLDRLTTAHWSQALSSAEGWEGHARVVLQCVNMRNKLLGLESPSQIDVQVRQGELVRVELLDLLDKDVLDRIRPLRDEMIRLTELRAGAIDVEATET